MRPDYLLLGHVTYDVLPNGAFVPGGTSLYAGLAAYRLGCCVRVVSSEASLPPDWPPAINVAPQPGLPPVFENHYETTGRRQVLHAPAAPIQLDLIPMAWKQASVVHLAPVLNEVSPQFIRAFPHALLGVTPQGWMRRWDTLPGLVHYCPWFPDQDLLGRISALVLSIEDVRGDEMLAQRYAHYCPLVVLTRGRLGATMFVRGTRHHIAAIPANECDPTGAGDVFAAALLVHLYETGDPFEAARFAACAAAIAVEGMGTSRIPTTAEVEQRMRSAFSAE